jgi:SAM-dependent methyltransferase
LARHHRSDHHGLSEGDGVSGFDPAWLDLREPADAEARSKQLLQRAAGLFVGKDRGSVADLGCGTGSLLRALAPLLPNRQRWLLIDGDPTVLSAAVPRLSAWADAAETTAEGLRLTRAGKEIAVAFREANLADDPLPVVPGEADLVGASALFDLVSAEWLERFVGRLADFGAPLYAALSYDGHMSWTPARPEDADVEALFNRHQTRDKGTGAALGPSGAIALAEALRRRGYEATLADSPWLLEAAHRPLIDATIQGVAEAVSELEPNSWVETWRNLPRRSAVIGHLDLLAIPKPPG